MEVGVGKDWSVQKKHLERSSRSSNKKAIKQTRIGACRRSTWKGLPRPEKAAGGTCLQSIMRHLKTHLWHFT